MNIFTTQNRLSGQALAFLTAVSMLLSFLPFSASVAHAATTGITATPSDLTLEVDEKGNFVVSTVLDDASSTDSTYIVVSDDGGGSFYNGTTGGACNSDTPDGDNQFAITGNKGVCYSNSTPGDYTVSVQLYDGEDSPIGSPYQIDVHVNTPEVVEVTGCTDDSASNYNPEATIEDDSCTFPDAEPVYGCMDAEATNYNAEATEDDGSCEIDINEGDFEECDEETQNCGDPVDDNEVTICVDQEPAWASSVADYEQGTKKSGADVDDNRSNTDDVLGEADWSNGGSDGFFSLGFGGSIVTEFDGHVIDVDGDDISIHEATNGNSYPEESALIEVSQNGSSWYEVGTASNLDDTATRVSYFDFSGTGLAWIKFVRVTDTSDASLHDADADGFDLDAVDASEKVCEFDVEPEGEIKIVKWIKGENKGPADLSDFSFQVGDLDPQNFNESGLGWSDVYVGQEYEINEVDIPAGYEHVATYCKVESDDKDWDKEYSHDKDFYRGKGKEDEKEHDWKEAQSWNDFRGGFSWKKGDSNIIKLSDEDDEVVCHIINIYVGDDDNSEEPLTCEADVNLLTNGGFEDVVVDNEAGWDIFQSGMAGLGWMIDWVFSLGAPAIANLEVQTSELWTPSEGNQYAELDSDWGGPGSNDGSGEVAQTHISQVIPTIPGKTYTLTWDFSARPDTDENENRLQVFVDDTVVDEQSAMTSDDTDWNSYTYSFVATGEETPIAFADDGELGSIGTFLDNVSLVCEPEGSDDEYTLTVEITGDGSGSVTSEQDGISCSTNGGEENICEMTYEAGTVVDLQAVADEGSNFDSSWTTGAGTCTGNTTPCQVTMNSNIDLVAHFGLNSTTTITTTSGGGGGGGRKIELTSGGGSGDSSDGTGDAGPIPQVLGEQVSVVPFGAPNAGAGGASPTSPVSIPTAWLGMVAIASSKRYVR